MRGTKKSVEIELKLVLPGEAEEPAVVAYLSKRHYTVEKLDPLRNVDTYLDTFDWSLMNSKLALRYRVSNGTAVYAVKSIGPIEEGVGRRMETEIPLDGPVDIPTVIPVKRIRKLVDGIIFPRKLLEQVQVRTDRRRFRVMTPEGAEIELAFDTSTFSPRGLHKPGRTQKLHELEAEILNGPETALGALSSLLSKKFGYTPSTASKFEVALQRFRITIPSKKAPEELRVRLDDRLDAALRKILTFQSQRFRDQLPGVQLDIDTEFVHQARVATRRMRSALRLFRLAIPERTGSNLAGELKWLAEKFGGVRDLDVFLLNLLRYKGRIEHFPGARKRTFESLVQKDRQGLLEDLCGALESSRYKTLERRLRQFLERPLPSRPLAPLAAKTIREVAPVLITEKFDAVIQQGRAVLEKPKLKEFHRLRIQMKRLRYACEFMAPAYEGALDPFIDRMVGMQDCLGELQDTVFARNFIESLYDDWKGKAVHPDLLFILGEIYQLQADIARGRRDAFATIWEPFSSEGTVTLLKEILGVQPGAGSAG